MSQRSFLRRMQYLNPGPGVKLAVFYLLAVLFLTLFLPWLPLPYAPEFLDLANPLLPPFAAEPVSGMGRHWLGTDQLGRDVLVNLLYGFQTAFLIALPVMVVALGLGTLLGSAAGFLGNRKFKISVAALVGLLLWLPAVLYYVFYLKPAGNQSFGAPGFMPAILWFTGISVAAYGLSRLLKTLPFLSKKVTVPVDELVLKTMEVLSSVPRLVLILSFSALAAPGIGNVLLLLSLTYWAGPARLVRAEVLKIKQLPYVEAAQVSGLTNKRLLFRHILPNAAPPLWVAFSFGLSSLLGLEATLSFLGIGLPPELPSWGRMLAGARMHPEAWWLVVFPAAALCFTILAIQTTGNFLQKIFGRASV